MPFLDLNGAKPLEGYPAKRSGRRTLGDPGTVPAGMMSAGGGGGFAAAQINRLSLDFIGRNVSPDQELFSSSKRLRARARELGMNNGLAIKFLAELEQNVVGENGITLQAKVRGLNGRETADIKRINGRIEEEWKYWCKLGRCTADGAYSFDELQRMAIRTIGCEGESIVKQVFGTEYNTTGLALQVLDNDQLDDTMMQRLDSGNEVRLGVEVNAVGRPQAFHLFNGHPQDPLGGNRDRTRVPAEYIHHTFIRRRGNQRRGYTWMSGAVLDMNQLDRYEEAVIVAARASAAKFMVIKQQAAEGYTGEDDEPGSAEEYAGAPAMSANAGESLVLEPGQDPLFIDPKFPGNNHRDFLKTTLRTIATGLLLDYPTLGNDLEGVNFSSIRAGLLDQRDCYRILQRWFINHFVEPVFQAWLRMALLTTLSDITLSPIQRDQMVWKARGWDWVDPLKDTQANVLKLQNGLTTYSAVLASQGLDFEEVMAERAAEQQYIEALGITLGTDITGVADTADDSQAGDDDSGGGKRSIPFARVLSVEKRSQAEIDQARLDWQERKLLPEPKKKQ